MIADNVEHDIVIGRTAGDRSYFCLVCTCGWVGGEFHESGVAQQVYDVHVDVERIRAEAQC